MHKPRDIASSSLRPCLTRVLPLRGCPIICELFQPIPTQNSQHTEEQRNTGFTRLLTPKPQSRSLLYRGIGYADDLSGKAELAFPAACAYRGLIAKVRCQRQSKAFGTGD